MLDELESVFGAPSPSWPAAEWPKSSVTEEYTGALPASLVGFAGPRGGGAGVLVRTGVLVTLSVATWRNVCETSLSSRSAIRWRCRAYRPSWEDLVAWSSKGSRGSNLPPLAAPNPIVESSTAKDSRAQSAATIVDAHSLELTNRRAVSVPRLCGYKGMSLSQDDWCRGDRQRRTGMYRQRRCTIARMCGRR